ncbi:MAG: WGR domain-containing protein [Pseudomonadota bacterium]|uniref:WGR domain-containing protein n=1 Tax=Caulobacter sp. CCH9-E1 TaxID=1768768 RepID=UPI0009ECB0B0|nr:WGR domain-containing protein [Caulobacter sp. CCH9-E1]
MDHELYRRDATRNMARFYGLTVVPGLFGQTGLCRTWGRIGARGGRSIVEWFATPGAAEARLEDLRRQKLRRGYQPAPSAW